MKVQDVTVDWKEGYVNPPKLQVLVNSTPDRSDLQFQYDDGLWYAEKDGDAEYFAWDGPGNEGGYSGHCFEITTEDGEQVTLHGLYSSRAGVANLRGFGPVVDVALTTVPETLECGHTFRNSTLTLPAAKRAVDLADNDINLNRYLCFSENEPYWIPVRDNGGGR